MFTGEIRRARSKRPMVIGLIFVLVVVLVVLLVPMPRALPATFTLVPGSVTAVTAPRDGVVAEVITADGAMVARGTVIAKYDVSEAQKKSEELTRKIEALEERKASGGKVSPAAKAAVTKAEAALKKETAALEKATRAGKGKTTPAMTAAQKKVDAAKAALEKAQLAAGPVGEALDKEIADQKAALEGVKTELTSASITSPRAGILFLKLEKGAALKGNDALGDVKETAKLLAEVKVPAGEDIAKGQAVEIALAPNNKKRLTFIGPAKNDVAQAEFDNSKGEAKPGATGDATIEGQQRSILQGMLR